MHNVEKWSNILKNLAVFTTQKFQIMFAHFSTLYMKGLRRCNGFGKNLDLGFFTVEIYYKSLEKCIQNTQTSKMELSMKIVNGF